MDKIIGVEFKDGGWGSPVEVIAVFDNGETKKIFSYFSDELSFSKAELIGKTEDQASALYMKKDKAYLQS